jgi:hypothetical protein
MIRGSLPGWPEDAAYTTTSGTVGLGAVLNAPWTPPVLPFQADEHPS